MDFPFGEPITVVTRAKTGVDDYGDDVFAETSLVVTGAFDPAIGYESTVSGDTVVTQPQALLPYNTPVTSQSVLVIRGDRYEVDGTPNPWRSPFTGWEAGLAVPLRRVTG
jgi:hypothetical protein